MIKMKINMIKNRTVVFFYFNKNRSLKVQHLRFFTLPSLSIAYKENSFDKDLNLIRLYDNKK
jgi:hypothetical protein